MRITSDLHTLVYTCVYTHQRENLVEGKHEGAGAVKAMGSLPQYLSRKLGGIFFLSPGSYAGIGVSKTHSS